MIDLLGPDATPDDIRLCMDSVMGQLLFQAHARGPHAPPMVQRETLADEEIYQVVKHIADFSLAGIEHFRKKHQENRGAKQ